MFVFSSASTSSVQQLLLPAAAAVDNAIRALSFGFPSKSLPPKRPHESDDRTRANIAALDAQGMVCVIRQPFAFPPD